MRLTLRTLLAYLDDVLDPADKEELGKKIGSSDFAEDLVHRTRDTVRRLRLSAPQVIGTGMGLDPNTVAEYLDNVMPPDQVGDFERICLESDVHLAEVTACHHVLTMILGQPADVDPMARQRMYTIASAASAAGDRRQLRVEPAHAMASTVAIVSPPSAPQPSQSSASAQQPRAVEIPEYLRTSAWWKSWGLAGLAALVVVGIVILLVSGVPGWFSHKQTVATMMPDTTPPAIETENLQTPKATSQTSTDSKDLTQTSPSRSAPALGPPPQPLTPGIPATGEPQAIAKSTEPDRYPPTGTVNDASAVPQRSAPLPSGDTPPSDSVAAQAPVTTPVQPTNPPLTTNSPVPSNPNPVLTKSDLPASPINASRPENATANIPVPPPTPPQTNIGPQANAPPANNLAATEPANTPTIPKETGTAASGRLPKAPVKPPELGTYMGGKTVLLRYDATLGTWFRIEPRAAVRAGERLLALPEFRPKVAFIAGPQLDLSGGSQVIVENGPNTKPDEPAAKADDFAASPDEKAAPSVVPLTPLIDVVYGRVVLTNPTSNDSRVKLKLGPTDAEAQLARNATLAIEVERMYVPGKDPRKAPAPVECRLFAPDGGVIWKDGAGSKGIDKPSRWTVTIAGASEPAADPAPPEWIYHEPIDKPSEQRIAPKLDATLVSKTPVDTQLLEIFQTTKQQELKSLVTKSCIHVGQFVPFVDALRDSDQRSNWKTQINILRSAMALSPDSANKVFQTLVDQRGRPAANDLFEMLCGYSPDDVGHTPEQIKNGAIAKLIDWLENDSLDYRVLAVQDLADITGKRLMSNPADSLALRTTSVKTWRLRLNQDQLKPLAPQK